MAGDIIYPGATQTLVDGTVVHEPNIDLDEQDAVAPEGHWPEPEELKPAAAAELVVRYQKEATEANAAQKKAKENKDRAEAIAKAVLEHYELDSIKPTSVPLSIYTEVFRTFTVTDEARFEPWEAEQEENYYETVRKLRGDIFLELCRALDDDNQPLPPGVTKYEEVRLHRKAIKPRKA